MFVFVTVLIGLALCIIGDRCWSPNMIRVGAFLFAVPILLCIVFLIPPPVFQWVFAIIFSIKLLINLIDQLD